MTKRLLIDGAIPGETRVALTDGDRLADFDVESEDARPLRSNIYLAKVMRVEPSLQAAFVEYGENRQGFLPFSEIHPDYYRIPTSDRRDLLAEEAAEEEGYEEGEFPENEGNFADGEDDLVENGFDEGREAGGHSRRLAAAAERETLQEDEAGTESREGKTAPAEAESEQEDPEGERETFEDEQKDEAAAPRARRRESAHVQNGQNGRGRPTESDLEAAREARQRRRALRRYKIQEVIQRGQVMLIQVIKDEHRGKGAAMTTYISLAGRYCVLMPNSDSGGGVSRKVTDGATREKLRRVLETLEVPEGMAAILRTAGSERSRTEIRRDFDTLLSLWEEIRTRTLDSTAPAKVHEDGNLIKRALRDIYTNDVEEVLVAGEAAWRDARDFMKALVPSHVRRVKHWDNRKTPLFTHYRVESILSSLHQPRVRLRSGGEIVISPTEALVAIDVNSGRSTRERHIERTAFKTNLEAAEEVARQLRIRDLAGLIVVDFIDMDTGSHIRDVERQLREALRRDRARVQVGRISEFGLLELSRQRLRVSLSETSTVACNVCSGTGRVLSPRTAGIQALRGLLERAVRRPQGAYELHAPAAVANHLLNKRRRLLSDLEEEYGIEILVLPDADIAEDHFRVEYVPPARGSARRAARAPTRRTEIEEIDDDAEERADADNDLLAEEAAPEQGADRPEEGAEGEGRGRKRRRGRRGGRRRNGRARAENVLGDDGEASQAHYQKRMGLKTGESEPDDAAPESGEPDGADDGRGNGETAEAEKPRRRSRLRRARKNAPIVVAEEDAAEKEAPEEAGRETGEEASEGKRKGAREKASAARTRTPGEGKTSETNGLDQDKASQADPQEEAVLLVEAGASRPKRRGWWN